MNVAKLMVLGALLFFSVMSEHSIADDSDIEATSTVSSHAFGPGTLLADSGDSHAIQSPFVLETVITSNKRLKHGTCFDRSISLFATVAHRDNCRNPLLQQPWDKKDNLTKSLERLLKPSSQMPVLPEFSMNVSQDSQQVLASRPKFPYAARVMSNLSWPEEEDLLRQKAMLRWRLIIESDVSVSQVGRQIEADINAGDNGSKTIATINDVFANKSTATLIKRSGDLLRYSLWCNMKGVVCPWRLDERIVYEYIQDLKKNSSGASSANSFISALRFMSHTIQLDSVHKVLTARVIGAGKQMLSSRGPIKQAQPLTVDQVYKLEKMALEHTDDKTRFIAGYLCFCLFSCARFSDAMYAESWILDAPNPSFGFLEARTKRFKTANLLKRSTFLPLVSFTNGLHIKSWAEEFFKLQETVCSGTNRPGFVLPGILRNGEWANRPMTTSEGSQALREILRDSGALPEGVSTHSLNVTLLSWASKAQLSVEDRRLLGHHVDRNQVSPLTYSRDALSGPLERMFRVIMQVRAGEFNPDESRATRTIRSLGTVFASSTNDSNTATETFENAVGEGSMSMSHFSVIAPQPDEDPGLETFSDGVSSEASDISDIEKVPEIEEENAMLDSLVPQRTEAFVRDGVYVSRESGLGHLMRDELGDKFVCGKKLTSSYRPGRTLTRTIHMCLRCQPSGRM